MSRVVTVTVTANGEDATTDRVTIDDDDARGLERAVQASKAQAMARLHGLMHERGLIVDAAREDDDDDDDDDDEGDKDEDEENTSA